MSDPIRDDLEVVTAVSVSEAGQALAMLLYIAGLVLLFAAPGLVALAWRGGF